ncbi:biotin-independent malonate decarboxylase subunit gamma [Mesorhizobium sp. YC-39]|uniref:biotin-independent malonate decarboxylase subunit gamma n=1 Tax=unclassified Mesorhizobium TaxID=325217 RepID=UPI0021E870F4|nr:MULTISPECIES: biotin-independent malonate decarboxylase subunit gamma [unclassified Mesorhizobium]MCV3206524.1 biotin-independent malonate decarboxylase subunit gamma [Mesorhizobium sp. YC-2]MCV3227076.1 biotin-independent malonate decarboxylase subunit gamma [Mesorhizobium sp. YC-39]
MKLDEILSSLFLMGHDIDPRPDHLILGTGKRANGGTVEVVGIADGEALGIEGVLPLARRVLDIVATGGKTPILVIVDTQGQLMSRRDEMLGLNEYLAHLAKCLLLASRSGHATVGLNYGKAVAGAFLATALATDVLVALPDAEPAVMDLPSMARVTKLPQEKLEALSKTTPVFAPGLDSMTKVGAIAQVWDPAKPLDVQFEATLATIPAHDVRDALGAERGGRLLAAGIARRVADQAGEDRRA